MEPYNSAGVLWVFKNTEPFVKKKKNYWTIVISGKAKYYVASFNCPQACEPMQVKRVYVSVPKFTQKQLLISLT